MACRRRIREELLKTPEGKARLENVDRRIDEALARDYERQQAREEKMETAKPSSSKKHQERHSGCHAVMI